MTTLWLITDNKPGHRSQLQGLAQALAARTAIETHWIDAPAGRSALWQWLSGRFPAGAALPDPDFILVAGHRTHLPGLAARRARGGRLIALMRPSLPLGWFDLCVIPQHDRPPARASVIATRGALNTARPSPERETDKGLFLIGGPSKHHGWDSAGLLAQIDAILAATPSMHWTLTTSRRTPADTESALLALQARGVVVRPVRDTPPGWAMAQVARSAQAWVTEDSVSMVYESLTAGAATGLLAVPRRGDTRITAGVAQLQREGFVTQFADWQREGRLHVAPQRLAEADRVAEAVLARWHARTR
ncbi:mitochondrial fission ELM1 family protein [Thauera sp.]|jgi:mitochondrial fission protein ELM1|uniref:mitochondrial fission ELM1 family protein n=1 Tax=Thauera sp. TaxID=1905334 RepID=UPI002A362A3B|nr:mitochondrial fission ELM1 family protein [Thauera sp.]MDX9887459.1 mitochondrial fission ELM1 family protein [Thauera sp.]